jgi:hypothetical protein
LSEKTARTATTHKRAQKTGRVELKSNETKRMITIRTLGWNFALYARGMTEKQEAMT